MFKFHNRDITSRTRTCHTYFIVSIQLNNKSHENNAGFIYSLIWCLCASFVIVSIIMNFSSVFKYHFHFICSVINSRNSQRNPILKARMALVIRFSALINRIHLCAIEKMLCTAAKKKKIFHMSVTCLSSVELCGAIFNGIFPTCVYRRV